MSNLGGQSAGGPAILGVQLHVVGTGQHVEPLRVLEGQQGHPVLHRGLVLQTEQSGK
jgi:hypothetical protein